MKNKNKIISTVLFLSVFVMLISCKKQSAEWKGTIQEENGVTVVKNPKEPIYGEDVLILEEELSIGEAEGPEEYMFSNLRQITVDDRGYIYALDLKEKHVKAYNDKGEYMTTIGKGGQGPGDIGYPGNVFITNQKHIMVLDSMNRRLTFFSLEGEFIKIIPTTPMSLLEAKIDSNGNIIGIDVVLDEENPRHELKKFSSDLNYLYSFDSSPLPDIRKLNPFMPMLSWDINKKDQIICGWPKMYEINIFDAAGNLIRKIEKDYEPLEINKEDKDKFKNRWPAFTLSIPKHHAAYWRFLVDDECRIYVMTREKVEDGDNEFYYDVFDSEGKYIAKIPIKSRNPVLKKNKLYTIEEDEDGLQIVKRYKVNWNYNQNN